MKNIYQDDFSPEKSTEGESRPVASSPRVNKVPSPGTVRSAKQAPPPIKKSAQPAQPVMPEAVQPPAGFYPPPGYYPQPVFYQPDPSQGSQPYPVYYAPVPPQPYPPVMYPQQTQPAAPAAAESGNNEAGTRVLFQSEDFDKKEEAAEETKKAPAKRPSLDFDISEETISSKKRAPAPVKKESSAFRVDEMEIGTYEFNIMTAGQSSKAKSVLTPDEEQRRMGLNEESFIDEILEDDTSSDEIEFEVEDVPDTREKKISTKEIIRRAILGISVLAIVIAGASLINEFRLHRQNQNLMSNVSELIITEPPTTQPTTSSDNNSVTVPSTLPLVERPLTPEEQWEVLRRENPDVVFPENIQLKYAKLYAQNTDFVGQLRADGLGLDFPIVQGKDDNEYIAKNFYGESTRYGCPFVTHTNNIETLDENTVIYGHNMRDGSIFAPLTKYQTLEGYKKAPVITFNTLYQDYQFKVFAVILTNIEPKHDNGYVFTYYWTNLNNEVNHTAYLNQLSQRSLYDTGVDVNPTDKLLTISTCSRDFDDGRLVIVARLVRPGENPEVDTSRAVKNENPRFPQAYYDKKGKKNPYADAYRWQIS